MGCTTAYRDPGRKGRAWRAVLGRVLTRSGISHISSPSSDLSLSGSPPHWPNGATGVPVDRLSYKCWESVQSRISRQPTPCASCELGDREEPGEVCDQVEVWIRPRSWIGQGREGSRLSQANQGRNAGHAGRPERSRELHDGWCDPPFRALDGYAAHG